MNDLRRKGVILQFFHSRLTVLYSSRLTREVEENFLWDYLLFACMYKCTRWLVIITIQFYLYLIYLNTYSYHLSTQLRLWLTSLPHTWYSKGEIGYSFHRVTPKISFPIRCNSCLASTLLRRPGPGASLLGPSDLRPSSESGSSFLLLLSVTVTDTSYE